MNHSIPNPSKSQNISAREEWRPVVGWEHLYEVSSLGRVRSLPRLIACPPSISVTGYTIRKQHILKASPDSHGHLIVVLCDNNYRRTTPIHLMVAAAFIGQRPDGCDTHHQNEDKTDNRVRNLEYLTRGDHTRFHHSGERSTSAKLTDSDARRIKSLARGGLLSQSQIGAIFGVSQSAVYLIKIGKNWRHLDDEQ